jgi:hypothetical protein
MRQLNDLAARRKLKVCGTGMRFAHYLASTDADFDFQMTEIGKIPYH